MQSLSSLKKFRFGQFEVDLPEAELRRNGRKVPIQDKPLHLLAFLSRHPGQIVARSEIQHHLWPPDTTVSFEDGLNTTVKKLREALHDNFEKPRYIETVRGRGYRFLVSVQVLPEEADAAGPRPVLVSESAPEVRTELLAAVSQPAPSMPSPALPAQPAGANRTPSIAGFLTGVAACIGAGIWLVHYNRQVDASGRP